MKIDKISCTQFAGLVDRELELSEGLNVICGKNESGKSSMVNLLSRILFQNSKLDGRSDKDFKREFFPVRRSGSSLSADYIDARLDFHTDSGSYRLEKEWSDSPAVCLKSPDGRIKTESTVNSVLREILIYGEGVYRDMLFSSQKNAAETLRLLLDSTKNTDAKKEVAEAAAQAFSESDGISADTVGEAIDKKIEELCGRHWDIESCAPVRKSGRWASGLGEILKAWYKLQDAQAVLDERDSLEEAVERTGAEFSAAEAEEKLSGARYDKFVSVSAALEARSERNKRMKELEAKLTRLKKLLSDWPEAEEGREKAVRLSEELSKRQRVNKFKAAERLKTALEKAERELEGRKCPESAEIAGLKAALRRKDTLENKLCGMNLRAEIKLYAGHELEIISLRDGRRLEIKDGGADIREACILKIPGIMELELSPADVNAVLIRSEIEKERRAAEGILEKYQVSSTEELEALRQAVSAGEAEAERLRAEFKALLNGEDYASLSSAAGEDEADIRPEEEIRRDISALCGRESPERFIASREGLIRSYSEDYGSISGLEAVYSADEAELDKAKMAAGAEKDIPAELSSVSDPAAYRERFKRELEAKKAACRLAMGEKSAAGARLAAFNDKLSTDPAEDAAAAERAFMHQKESLEHWLHIREVFLREKEKLEDNPMEELGRRFCYNLRYISGGSVKGELARGERLSPGIYSDERLMDYDKLSHGTRDSVSLAFRLAVLDHLFPEGGGIIVFDDPFTDMDDERSARAAELIKESAARHQIIFLTCRRECAGLLSKDVIEI